MEYDVTAVPTLILFKDGKELARQTGAMRKDDLVAWLDGALK
jgi:thioredoxin-like negative regulator of GroEL